MTKKIAARVEVRRLDKAAVLRKFKWSEKDFELAQSCEFPAAMKRPPKLGSWTFTLVWPENVLDGWAAKQREKVAVLERLVGR
jgi:hypothetical protein